MKKSILLMVMAAGVLALLVWAFTKGHEERADESQGERSIKTASRVSIRGGETVVSLDQSMISRSGVKIETLAPTKRRLETRAYGTAVDPQPLSDLRVNLTKARAAAAEAQRDFVRQQELYAAGQGVSKEAVQEAQVIARSDEAAVMGFTAQANEQWGDVIAKWITNGAPELGELFQVRSILLLVSVPSNVTVPAPPEAVLVGTSRGKMTSARFVSRALRADPRLQGESLFYMVTVKDSGILPGMNVDVLMPLGAETAGVIVPREAVVWSRGKAWAYVERKPNEFTRCEIATDVPVEQGWFVTHGFAAGDRIVTSGAQLLLSEELRAQIGAVGD
jgi:membrane fusion protein, multidrug efflux system